MAILNIGLEDLLDDHEAIISEVCPDELLYDLEAMKDVEYTLENTLRAYDNLTAIYELVESGADCSALERVAQVETKNKLGLKDKLKNILKAIIRKVAELINKARIVFKKYFNMNGKRIKQLAKMRWEKMDSEVLIKDYHVETFLNHLRACQFFVKLEMSDGNDGFFNEDIEDKVLKFLRDAQEVVGLKDDRGYYYTPAKCEKFRDEVIAVFHELPNRLDELAKAEKGLGALSKQELDARDGSDDHILDEVKKTFNLRAGDGKSVKDHLRLAGARIALALRAYNSCQKRLVKMTSILGQLADK